MARRLALLVLACAAAMQRPHYSDASSDSASYDSFSIFDDYDESFEPVPKPRPSTASPKVILKGPSAKLNASLNDSNNKQKFVKTTNIKIESHTNFIVTKKPVHKPSVENKVTRPVVQLGDQYILLDVEDEVITASKKPTTRRPTSAQWPSPTRRPSSSRRPNPTRRPSSTRRPIPSRRPTKSTTKRRPPATSPRPIRTTYKITKPTPTKKTSCPPKKTGWLSTFFKDNQNQKKTAPKKPSKSGIFSRIYKWISSSIFGGNWFDESKEKSTTIGPTTPTPVTTTSKNWYQALLDDEDNDGDRVTEANIKKKISSKKSEKRHYKGFKLLRAYLDVKKKVNDMLDLKEEGQGSGLMWCTPPSLNSSTDLLVPPDLMADVKDYLQNANIDYEIVIWDLQKAIAYENPSLSLKQRRALEQLNGHPMTWRRYHRYADILRYLEYLQHSYTDMVELIPLGRSSEGLPLVAVKVSVPVNETQKNVSSKEKKKWKLRSRMKPAVWVDGGAHAREWIAPAVATWMLRALVEGDKGLGADFKLLEQADFYIMPVMNPDGYEHSHTHDRLWKKTRSRQPEQSDDYFVAWFQWWKSNECVGVDADRNWDYNWGKQDSSQDPCDENYSGSHPFSEPETRAVADFLTEHRRQIKVYISLHAYTQAWIVPSSETHSSVDGELMEMGELATAALADAYSTKYQVGTVAQIRQPASGMSHDWAKTRAGIPFSYHVDLRDSFGPYGFLLPGAKIVSTAHETWMAVKAIVDNLNPP
ncbi:carboxypeptidase A4-like isoform X2 [Plodia interpunctella]|uniref:carboxypeptidase A4-like isoform X2 n=1 Tax=Plodia interpunctella TaxID=58824 RepID=UPI002368694A|nr:carboxypeptidase A4-like isoform X2 [Plodia interpunctella]